MRTSTLTLDLHELLARASDCRQTAPHSASLARCSACPARGYPSFATMTLVIDGTVARHSEHRVLA